MKRKIKKIWTKYDNLDFRSKEKIEIGIQNCFAELDKFSEDERCDEYYYLKGFLHYMSEPSEQSQAQNCFRQSLEIKLTNGHPGLYLGYSLYDTGFYKEAEHHFSLVDKGEFGVDIQDFIQMKIEEMLVCCQVKISNLDDKSLLASKKLISKYKKTDYLDDYLFNLYNALKEFGINLDELASDI